MAQRGVFKKHWSQIDETLFRIPETGNEGEGVTTFNQGGVARGESDAFAVLEGLLRRWGLGGLTDFVWDRLIEGQPESRIMLELRDQPEYKRRFPGLEARREAGLPALSEAEYLQQETAYKAVLRQAGADPEEYDDPQDLADYFAGNISPQELSERADLWQVITQAPDMTAKARASFQEHAGLRNVTDEQLFDTLLGADDTLLRQYEERTGRPLNTRSIRQSLEQALREEAARFEGGGGQVRETREGRVGLVGAEQETF